MDKFKSVFLVDDDPSFVFIAKKIIKVANFAEEVHIYRNGQLAIDAFKELLKSDLRLPDVILLDINMPVMDGWGFLEEFSKIKLSQPIVIYVITSSVNPIDKIRASAYSEVNSIIVKPITLQTLKDIMVELL